mgnify:FL=1
MNRRTGPRQIIVSGMFAAVFFLFSTTAASAALGEENLRQNIPAEGLKVYFIQLTSGEATLIQTPEEETILVDTGSSFSKDELFSFFNEQEIRHIDRLVITNAQDEHFGNFKDIYDTYEPRQIYFPFYLEDYFQQLELGEATEAHALKRGDSLEWGESNIHILHPTVPLSLGMKDNSLVFQLVHGEQRFLFMSEATRRVEQELLNGYDLHSQILKVGDFGSLEASGEDFLKEVDAHVAVIFYRPEYYLEPEVLERLEESWVDVYPVKQHGHILVISQKDDYDVFMLPPKQDS